jgi:hypothetical protein
MGNGAQASNQRANLFDFQHLRRFFAELADDADGDLLAFLHRERMALVAVNAGDSQGCKPER